MKKVANYLNYLVFIAATLAIMGVFYEGMAQKWYKFVGVLIIIMDYTFLLATITNIFAFQKTKWMYLNIFSLVFILVAFVMKFLEISYPIIGLVFWYFYIWFLYGIRITIFKEIKLI